MVKSAGAFVGKRKWFLKLQRSLHENIGTEFSLVEPSAPTTDSLNVMGASRLLPVSVRI
jgi:hypothetical protein